MAQFHYKALHPSGKVQRGVLEAQNIYDLSRLLEKSKITLIWAKERKEKFLDFHWNRKPKTRDLIEFSFQLSRLLESGVPLLESLQEIATHLGASPLNDTIVEVVRDVESGTSFSDALQKHDQLFDEVFLGLVNVGEKTGKLVPLLKDILTHLQWKENIKHDTQRALRYPLLLGTLMIAAVITLLVILVPQMVHFLSSLGVKLSRSTQILMSTTYFLTSYGIYCVVGLGFLFLGTSRLYHRSKYMRMNLETLLLKVPLYGPFLRKMAIEKFSHVMAITFRNGIDILECLEVSRTIIPFAPIQEEIATIQRAVASGQSLSQAISEFSRLSPLTIRMVKIGEQSSSLSDALTHVHEYYAQDIKNEIDRLIALLEPALLLMVGAVIAWIVMAMFWPLYEASSHLEVF
ncbi:PulF/GspF-like type II secretion protein [Candidatus Bealeia paramacronuclearis]|uniref:type II secretion system F family protein n=1 Tax=Candidatus Bealeia paramacronuclearis TaxID=1921001 RepID=UPI002C020AB3|nr:PulF/GspF-like type II secretion protein [Candidatus Bealeia paramacronuclearis]